MSTQTTSPIVGRIIIAGGVVALVAIICFFVIRWNIDSEPVHWGGDFLNFKAGTSCLIFPEPKLVIFIGNGGSEEVFDCISGCASCTITAYDGRSTYDYRNRPSRSASTVLGDARYTYECQKGKTTWRFFDGKCKMVISGRGTKLTLPDGREFTIDGKTPIWLRCKSDGTVDRLAGPPEGFDEFFENPPPEPGLLWGVRSYPDAFRK